MFLRDIDIFELLGLTYLDEKKKDDYLAKMLQPILTQAITRGVEESNLPEDKLDYLLELVDKNTDVETLQIESIKLMPQLINIIQQETYVFKKGALLDQLNSVEKDLETRTSEDLVYFKTVIQDLKANLSNENENTFENAWKLYVEQKKKFTKKD